MVRVCWYGVEGRELDWWEIKAGRTGKSRGRASNVPADIAAMLVCVMGDRSPLPLLGDVVFPLGAPSQFGDRNCLATLRASPLISL